MVRFFTIMILGALMLVQSGCNGSQKGERIWENVKIGDLAPTGSEKEAQQRLVKTISFDVYVFGIPGENISVLDEIWHLLRSSRLTEGAQIDSSSTGPLRFDDYGAFSANLFAAGFGQAQIWNNIANLLRAAGAKRMERISVLLSDGEENYVTIAKLYKEQTVFFISVEESPEAVTIGPGGLTLRIKAEKIPGSRGLCRASVMPIFLPAFRRLVPQSANREESGYFSFTCCGFELKMSPGDFVFMGPRKYASNQTTLSGLFFSGQEDKHGFPYKTDKQKSSEEAGIFRTFLLVCANIID